MTTPAKKQIPSLAELHHDLAEAFKSDQLNFLLNQPVPEKWVKDHPFAKNVKYLPIDKVEFLLTKIFQQWRVEVVAYSQLFNSVSCHVRLHYMNPVTGEWSYHDGLGAVGVQTDAGKAASDLSAIKQDAIMKALPAAESYAIKDAAEKLGKLFGKDLNRKDPAEFSGAYTTNPEDIDRETEELRELFNLKEEQLTEGEKIDIERILKNREFRNYGKIRQLLKSK